MPHARHSSAKPAAGGLFGKRWQAWAWGGALLAVAWLAGGYRVYWGNHALQIPLVQSLTDPTLFEGDPFAATLQGYAALLWRGIARAVAIVPLEVLFALLFAVEKVCLLWAGASLARALRPQSALAPWAGALVMALGVPSLLGSGKITAPYFEQTGASIPFFLWGLAAMVRGRPWAWAVLGAVGTTLNPMYGVYWLSYCAVGIPLIHARSWYRWLLPGVALGALAFPALLLAARSHAAREPQPSVWLEAAASRFSHHLFPLQWSGADFAGFGLLLVVVLAFGLASRRGEQAPASRFVLAATICGVGWLALAFAAAYALRSPGLLVLHPARGTDFWYCAGALFLVAHFASQVEAQDSPARAASLVGLVVSVFLLRSFTLPQAHLAAGALLLLALHPAIWQRLGRPMRPRRVMAGLVAVALVFGGARVGAIYAAHGTTALWRDWAQAGQREVAEWARANTDKSALFVVPLDMDMFRPIARRGVVTTWKDGSAILWDRSFVTEWVVRVHALGRRVVPEGWGPWPVARTRYPQGWTDRQLAQVCQRFGAQFCVLPTAHRTALPVVFQGRQGYKIVRPALRTGERPD